MHYAHINVTIQSVSIHFVVARLRGLCFVALGSDPGDRANRDSIPALIIRSHGPTFLRPLTCPLIYLHNWDLK